MNTTPEYLNVINFGNYIELLDTDNYDDVLQSSEEDLFYQDDYNDLLIIEKKIKELYEKGLLDDEDLEIIEHVSDGKPMNEVGLEVKKSKLILAKRFYAICNKIAYSLGGQFTDEGYLDYMQEKYNLAEEEIEVMRKHMLSRFKYTIMRKII